MVWKITKSRVLLPYLSIWKTRSLGSCCSSGGPSESCGFLKLLDVTWQHLGKRLRSCQGGKPLEYPAHLALEGTGFHHLQKREKLFLYVVSLLMSICTIIICFNTWQNFDFFLFISRSSTNLTIFQLSFEKSISYSHSAMVKALFVLWKSPSHLL